MLSTREWPEHLGFKKTSEENRELLMWHGCRVVNPSWTKESVTGNFVYSPGTVLTVSRLLYLKVVLVYLLIGSNVKLTNTNISHLLTLSSLPSSHCRRLSSNVLQTLKTNNGKIKTEGRRSSPSSFVPWGPSTVERESSTFFVEKKNY